ncbi:hypothetical protein CU048_06685 [Beijerinckiaceae bacterium]|nr:hypothetical protein CU048_06685 [Beijerinckiaceae bacterium]
MGMAYIRDLITAAGLALDVAGVLVILIGAAAATILYVGRRNEAGVSFRLYRKNLGRSILLGLEFMVGGDIIRTVSVEHPGLDNVLVLGMIVLIRTILSWSMEVEIEGRWPWRAWFVEKSMLEASRAPALAPSAQSSPPAEPGPQPPLA